MKRKESLAKEMTSKTKDLENQISAIEKELGAVRTQLDGRKEAIEELARESRDAEEEKAKLDDERRYSPTLFSIQLAHHVENYGGLKQRFRRKRIAPKTSFERPNNNCTTQWIEMFKPASPLPLV
jgi:septal ring factor EnvC (AmiA/AmiB activator)